MKDDEQYRERLVELRPLCRFIQAAVEKLGREKARELAAEAFEAYAHDRFVAQYEALPQDQRWPIFRDTIIDGADCQLYSLDHFGDEHVSIKYHECLFLEIFKDFGLEDFVPLYCRTDFTTCRKIDPRIELTRTKTLAEGAPYCDHCWRFKTY